MLDWLIVGGGLHGTHLALTLLARGGANPARLRILDPHAALLAHWERCTTRTGMAFLRSTVVHHLAPDPHDLWIFARRRGSLTGQFRGPYRRPALALFQAHCAELIATYGLDQLHLRGRATGLRRARHGWCVETSQGAIATRRVLLALSAGEQPRWPAWATALRAAGGPIAHLYGDEASNEQPAPGGPTVVIGGGISAAQLAMALARRVPGGVTLLLRHDLRVEPFDSGPCWLGPKCLSGFHAEPRPERRRAMIRAARNPGSVPEDVARSLRRAERWGLLRTQRGEVLATTRRADGAVSLQLDEGNLTAAHIVLATGFDPARPGGTWLDDAIAAEGLALAPCGYPLIDRRLCWAPGLYVTGGLAELELGPPARNIAGARHAGERLAALALAL
ncbi:MAG: FAD/NAD(P)-binding protein [Chloroflexi bacterium OHK40]